jgi:hypothetical protein
LDINRNHSKQKQINKTNMKKLNNKQMTEVCGGRIPTALSQLLELGKAAVNTIKLIFTSYPPRY